MVILARVAFIRRLVESGRKTTIMMASGGEKVKIKVTIHSEVVTSMACREVTMGTLALLEQYIEEARVVTGRGHRHSNGIQVATFWLNLCGVTRTGMLIMTTMRVETTTVTTTTMTIVGTRAMEMMMTA